VTKTPDDVRIGLAGDRALTDWRSLRPHNERRALFVVSDGLDLLDAAEAVAVDDTARVAEWLARGLLARPLEDQVAAWTEEPDTTFEFVIVQPFVLVALADDQSSGGVD